MYEWRNSLVILVVVVLVILFVVAIDVAHSVMTMSEILMMLLPLENIFYAYTGLVGTKTNSNNNNNNNVSKIKYKSQAIKDCHRWLSDLPIS